MQKLTVNYLFKIENMKKEETIEPTTVGQLIECLQGFPATMQVACFRIEFSNRLGHEQIIRSKKDVNQTEDY